MLDASPLPAKTAPETLTFGQALLKVVDGHRITKLEWDDRRTYGVLESGLLHLHKAGEDADKLHPWIVNDGDILGIDWIVLPDIN